MQVGVHYGGTFYEFVPWNGVVSWEINQWGYWYISAENESHMVSVQILTPFMFLPYASTEITVSVYGMMIYIMLYHPLCGV